MPQTTAPVAPQNLDAEESVLGAMLLSAAAIDAAREALDPDDFYRESHGIIFAAAVAMHRRGDPVDAITLADELEQHGDLERAGGNAKLLELAAVVPATSNAAHYARIVKDAATLRGLVTAGQEIQRLGQNRPGETPDLLHRARAIVDDITRSVPTAKTKLTLVPVRSFAAVDEPGAEPLVVVAGSEKKLRAAIPASALVMVYGDGGAGKTTLLVDLALHLAAGDTWCGVLQPVRPLRVAWIENEGPRPMMRAKFDEKLQSWHGSSEDDRLLVLDEPWANFTFRDDSHRAQLAAALTEHDIDIVVAGPLSRLGMEGGGTSDEINTFRELIDDVLDNCSRRPTLLLIHHENRAGQISGTWEREPDTLIHVQGQGHGRTRLHWAKARWSSDLHGTNTQLLWADGDSFTVETKPEVTEDTMTEELLDAVRDHPGESWSQVRKHVRGKAEEIAKVRNRLIRDGQLVNLATQENRFKLALPESPEAHGSHAGTDWEPLQFPSPDGATEPVRSPVPYVSRNGEGNGTDSGDPGPQFEGTDDDTTTDPDEYDQAMIDALEVERLEALAEQADLEQPTW